MRGITLDSDSDMEFIKGVHCNVQNCAHHDGDSYCTAKKINVGPMQARSSVDTVCSTFKPKEF